MSDSRLDHLRKLVGREKNDFDTLLAKQLPNQVNNSSLGERITQGFGNPDMSMIDKEGKYLGEQAMQKGQMDLSHLIDAQNYLPFSPFKGAGMIPKIANAASRIGQGTASGTAQDLIDPNNKKGFGESILDNLGVNTGIEAVTMPFRGMKSVAEHINPQELTNSLIEQGAKLYKETGKEMRSKFKEVFKDHGESLFSPVKKAKDFIDFSKSEMRHLMTQSGKIYKDILEKPTLNNLHNLKKQLAKDYHKIKDTPALANQAQAIYGMKEMVEEKLKSSLSKIDKKLVKGYEAANEFANKNFYPFEATKRLKTISRGKSLGASPSQYSREIIKGIENGKIGENHILADALRKISNKKEIGNLMKHGIGTVGGGLLGSLMMPGAGTAGGAALGLAGSMSKYAEPLITEAVQNPKMKALLKYLTPLFYGSARNYEQKEGK